MAPIVDTFTGGTPGYRLGLKHREFLFAPSLIPDGRKHVFGLKYDENANSTFLLDRSHKVLLFPVFGERK